MINNSKTSTARNNQIKNLQENAPDLKYTFSNGARAKRDSLRFEADYPLRRLSRDSEKQDAQYSCFRKNELIFFLPSFGNESEGDPVIELRIEISGLLLRTDRQEILTGWLDALETHFGIQIDRTCVKEIARPWPRVSDKHLDGYVSCGAPRTLEEVLLATNSEEEKGGNCES